MALKPDLRARQTQSLNLTPQLVQSLHVLQVSHVDLERLVQTELERNPLLKRAASVTAAPRPTQPISAHDEPSKTGWDLDSLTGPGRDLRAEVNEQMLLLFDTEQEHRIADIFVGSLDDAGYVTIDITEAAELAGVSAIQAEAVLLALQANSDPAGLFARNLSECLRLQLENRSALTASMRLLLQHLDLLAHRDFAALRRLTGADEEELHDMLGQIRALDPKPGLAFQPAALEAAPPDIIMRERKAGGWTVTINNELAPELTIDRQSYEKLLPAASREEKAFLKRQMRDAAWLIRALKQRDQTILKITTEIIRHQEPFFRNGVDALKPLTLNTIAKALGMHETTVSRAIANKLIETPRGMFELRFFFPAALAGTNDGDARSAEAARYRIRRLIAAETATSVLSDAALALRLNDDGIKIARRTVVKYREAMNIPSSVIRRREKKQNKVGKA